MGWESYSEIDTLPITPDLAIICTDADSTPFYLAELGKRGTQAAVLLSHGYFRFDRDRREVQRATVMDIAQAHGMRILGPNCLGFINPSVGVNASLAHREALPGRIAFVSQIRFSVHLGAGLGDLERASVFHISFHWETGTTSTSRIFSTT